MHCQSPLECIVMIPWMMIHLSWSFIHATTVYSFQQIENVLFGQFMSRSVLEIPTGPPVRGRQLWGRTGNFLLIFLQFYVYNLWFKAWGPTTFLTEFPTLVEIVNIVRVILSQNWNHLGQPDVFCGQNQISVPNWNNMIRLLRLSPTHTIAYIIRGLSDTTHCWWYTYLYRYWLFRYRICILVPRFGYRMRCFLHFALIECVVSWLRCIVQRLEC